MRSERAESPPAPSGHDDETARALLAAIVESSSDSILSWTLDRIITSWNAQATRMYGYTAGEAVGRSIYMLIPEERHPAADQVLAALRQGRSFEQFETERLRKDGARIDVALTVFPIRDAAGRIVGAGTIGRDIGERKRAEQALRRSEEQLRAALAQREMLLREVDHRVKNNLQMVSSLLGMQARQLTDTGARQQFEDAVARIQAIATVHRALYRGGDITRASIGDYIHTLCDQIAGLHSSGPAASVRCRVETCDLTLPADQVAPFALILNELLTNAFKHAYAPDEAGVIAVGVARTDPAGVRLEVSDQGRGLPADFDPDRSDSLGMRLISALARQLGGAIRFERPEKGLRCVVTLPL